jgi:hypothetical protein
LSTIGALVSAKATRRGTPGDHDGTMCNRTSQRFGKLAAPVAGATCVASRCDLGDGFAILPMVLRSPRAVGLTYDAEGWPEQTFGRSNHMKAMRWSAALLVLSMLLLAACGDDDPSPEEAMADLCTDLTELQASVQNLTQVSTNPNATVDQLEDARDEVNEQMDAVESAAEDVDQAEVDALNEAYDNLDQAIDDIDDSATLADASASVQDEIQAVNTAWDQVLSGLQCQ